MTTNIGGAQPPPTGAVVPNGSNLNWNSPANTSNIAHHPNSMPIASGNNSFTMAINNNTNNVANPVPTVPTTSTTKNQLEQLNTMRESLFSHDGWGCQHVNQDTNWDVPGSPDPTTGSTSVIKADGSGQAIPGSNNANSTGWKQNINNGTELWEANLRNGGQPASAAIQKTPWGHTPSTNLGGTWGEDDEGVEATNVWTGPAAQQWNQQNTANAAAQPANSSTNAAAGGVWPTSPNVNNSPANGSNIMANPTTHNSMPNVTNPNIKKEGEWNTNVNPINANPNWVESRGSNNSIDARNGDQRDPRDQMREMRGDPRGISGKICQLILFYRVQVNTYA